MIRPTCSSRTRTSGLLREVPGTPRDRPERTGSRDRAARRPRVEGSDRGEPALAPASFCHDRSERTREHRGRTRDSGAAVAVAETVTHVVRQSVTGRNCGVNPRDETTGNGDVSQGEERWARHRRGSSVGRPTRGRPAGFRQERKCACPGSPRARATPERPERWQGRGRRWPWCGRARRGAGQERFARRSVLRQCHFRGIVLAMRASIDRAGRIVVPKPLRQALGLKPGQPLEIRAGDGRLEIEVAPTPMHLKKRGKGPVAVPEEALPLLTADQVRETLERVRR